MFYWMNVAGYPAGITLPGGLVSAGLAVMLAFAVASDLRARRVSNRLNLAILIVGAAIASLIHGMGGGARSVLSGLAVALVIWFPMFALRLMGAGDVKLMAACGAWLGWQGVVIASLATGVFGGVLGIVWLLRSHGAMSALHTMATAVRSPWVMKLRPYEARERVPYALAIAGGVCVAWLATGGLSLQVVHP
jgi:prepilin peptidase CpaA